jgi:hypothetical protein
MALNVEMVTFDSSDPAKLAGWWADQFEGKTQELIPGEFVAVIRPEEPRLGFQKVADPTPGKTESIWISARPMSMLKSRGLPAPAPPRSAGTASATAFAGWC